MLRYISIFLILFSLSCKDFALSEKKEIAGIISVNEERIFNNDTFYNLLPIGSKIILTDFPKEVPLQNKELSSLLNEWSAHFDTMNNKEASECFVSATPIQYRYYEIEELLLDTKPSKFENVFRLPNKNEFSIHIEKVSSICNDAINLPIQYCIAIKKGNEYIKRYNIGYIHYGDLSETTKYWYIDTNYIIHTRIVGDVAGNEETYVHKIKKFKLTHQGDLVDYFDKSSGQYEDEEESGLVKNHMKNGLWIEKNTNYGYLDTETYVEAQYANGLPVGKWKYYELETIEEVNDEGYVINTLTQKGSKLLMTEEYSNNGDLIKREILD